MSLVPRDALVPVKSIGAEVFSGSFPTWIVDVSDGGSTSAFDASHDGGYWALEPGTASPGDEARLETSFAVQPDAYDVVELATRVRVTTVDETDLAFSLGFSAPDGPAVTYSYLHPDGERDDQVHVVSDGTGVSVPARRIDDTSEHGIVLRWDTTQDALELLTDRFRAATATDVDIDGSRAYAPTWRAAYRGGDAASLRVHDAAIGYYNRTNP